MSSANTGLSARKPCGQNWFFQKVTLMAYIGNIATTGSNLGMEKWQKLLEWSRREDRGLHEDINKTNGWENGSGWGKGQSPFSTGQCLGVLSRFLAMVRKAAEGDERGRNPLHVLLMNHLAGKVLQGQGSHMICYGRCWARYKTCALRMAGPHISAILSWFSCRPKPYNLSLSLTRPGVLVCLLSKPLLPRCSWPLGICCQIPVCLFMLSSNDYSPSKLLMLSISERLHL